MENQKFNGKFHYKWSSINSYLSHDQRVETLQRQYRSTVDEGTSGLDPSLCWFIRKPPCFPGSGSTLRLGNYREVLGDTAVPIVEEGCMLMLHDVAEDLDV